MITNEQGGFEATAPIARPVADVSPQAGITATCEYTCRRKPGGTRVTLRASCQAKGITWPLASLLIHYLMKRADAGQPTALKRLLESAAE